MNGSGIPVIGMMPTVIPMLTNTWKPIIATIAPGDQHVDLARGARMRPQAPPEHEGIERDQEPAPTKPNISEVTAKMKSVWCSGRKSLIAWVAPSGALAERAARADGRLALVELIAGVAAVALGAHERREPLHLVVWSTVTPAWGRIHRTPRIAIARIDPDHREVRPRHADQEQDRRQDGRVDQRGPEVGLQEHDARGDARDHPEEERVAGRPRSSILSIASRPGRSP